MPPRLALAVENGIGRAMEDEKSHWHWEQGTNVLRRRRNEVEAFLYAFDLLELDGTDLRREPIETRKATLASILRKAKGGVRLNEHLAHDCGLTVFQHSCQLGCEGIVSKRLGSRYRSGRSPDWLKFKNPAAPAVRREAEEDWGR